MIDDPQKADRLMAMLKFVLPIQTDIPSSRGISVWIGSTNFSIAISLSAFCGSSIMDYPLIRRRLARDFLRLPCSVFHDAHYRVDLGPHLHAPFMIPPM